jgi:hypothetical protein
MVRAIIIFLKITSIKNNPPPRRTIVTPSKKASVPRASTGQNKHKFKKEREKEKSISKRSINQINKQNRPLFILCRRSISFDCAARTILMIFNGRGELLYIFFNEKNVH